MKVRVITVPRGFAAKLPMGPCTEQHIGADQGANGIASGMKVSEVDLDGALYESVIVQPFVLVQSVGDEPCADERA